MRRSRIATLAVSIIMAAAAIIGVAGVGPASAFDVPGHYLCLKDLTQDGSDCIYAQGLSKTIAVVPFPDYSDSMTNWTWSTKGYGHIGQEATAPALCMELNAADADAVREAKCTDDAASEWAVTNYDPSESIGGFRSKYDPSLCLTFLQEGTDAVGGATGILEALVCENVPDQQFLLA
jgi:hypothetical protein